MKPAKRRPGKPKTMDSSKDSTPHASHESSRDSSVTHNDAIPDTGLSQPMGRAHLDEFEEGADSPDDSWETESLLADILEDSTDSKGFINVEDACGPHEAVQYRQMLRAVGPAEFCRRTIDAGVISVKKLLTAFGVRPPPFLEGSPDFKYLSLLSLAISRELQKRAKLMSWNTVDDAVELLKRSKNIIVLTGAGISTSLGIPDFRSSGTGLYSRLAELDLKINDPQEVFDIETFRHDPTIFFSVAKNILPDIKKFSPTHAFIAMLQNMGKLLTNYSQNIDNIEANAGISPEKLVQCHGSFATATCQRCGYNVDGEAVFPDIKAGRIPRCERCIATLRANGKMKRKRAQNGSSSKRQRYCDDTDDEDFDIPEAGIMKPDITFFGEALPDKFSERLVKHDHDLVDLVVVIGTSLKVAPVSEVVPYLPSHIPQIYISKTPVSHINFDIDLIGECDVVVAELCRRAGWKLEHPMIPPNQKVKIELEEGYWHRHVFTAIKPSEPEAKREPLARLGSKVNKASPEPKVKSEPRARAEPTPKTEPRDVVKDIVKDVMRVPIKDTVKDIVQQLPTPLSESPSVSEPESGSLRRVD